MSLTAVGTKMFPTGQQRIDGTVLGSCCMSDKSGRNPNTRLQDNNSLKQGITGNRHPAPHPAFVVVKLDHVTCNVVWYLIQFYHGETEPRCM